MESGIDIAIGNLKNELMFLKMELSEKRKKGFDTSIAQMHIPSIPSKIQMAEITKDPQDVQKAKQWIDLVKKELSLAEPKNEYIMMKDEKLPEEKHEEQEDVGVALNNLIADAHLAIREINVERAIEHYSDINKLYQQAPAALKKSVYLEIIEVYRKISEIKNPKSGR